MTRLLLRLFVRNADQTGDPKVRSAYGVLSGAVGILCNFLLFAGKLAVGTISGSVSVTADAVNNLSDASSSIVTLVGFRIAEKPADEGHPYGHARVEYLSGLVVAALILIIGVELAKTSVEKFSTRLRWSFPRWWGLFWCCPFWSNCGWLFSTGTWDAGLILRPCRLRPWTAGTM